MSNAHEHIGPDINPATNLPLLEDTWVDVSGNPYGTDWNTWQLSYDPSPSYEPPAFDPW